LAPHQPNTFNKTPSSAKLKNTAAKTFFKAKMGKKTVAVIKITTNKTNCMYLEVAKQKLRNNKNILKVKVFAFNK